MVRIGLEVMGGDKGPLPALKGVSLALKKTSAKIVAFGQVDTLRQISKTLNLDSDRFSIVEADQVVLMSDSPTLSLKKKPNSSLKVAFDHLKANLIDALISPSNTGAVMVTAIYTLGLFPFLKRPAIGTIIPRMREERPFLLVDAGANAECDAQELLDFGSLGLTYYRALTSILEPKIALISNGTEEKKGTDTTRAAYSLFKTFLGSNFIGYIEGKDLLKEVSDIGVCDGFIGNILLKALEGTAEFVVKFIKENMKGHPLAALGLWLMSGHLKRLYYKKLSPSAYGGAPLLGVNGLVLIAHGASDEFAFLNSILTAEKFVKMGLLKKMEESFISLHSVA